MSNGSHSDSLIHQLNICEQLISRNNYETACLFKPDGELIFKKRGTTKSVRFSRSQLMKMPGNILTHNHVFEQELAHYGLASAISSSDIALAFQHKLLEIRMTLGDARYSFKWTNAEQSKANDLINRLETVESGCKALLDKIDKKLYNLEYTTEDEYYTDYFATVRKNAEDINTFLESNSDVGYVFDRED